MTYARIYRPAKTAMQSGRAKTRRWLLEYSPVQKPIEPIMGWVSGVDTQQQLRLMFDTLEAAVKFAEEKAIPYQVETPHVRLPKSKSYAENFSFNRVETCQPQPKA